MKVKTSISIVAFLGLLAGCTPTDSGVSGAIVEESPENIVQSYPQDTKEYRYIKLDNGMKVMLVSNANTRTMKAAASLSVGVGSYQDPNEWQGLAHFLEHMLFLGTEKYPAHDDYGSFLESNGGFRNAYTGTGITNYHFSVNNNAFEGALDRFSQFFISPLFTEKYVDREKNAVHSEYFTRINKSSIREMEVIENVINPLHPAYKFNAGNLETLVDKPDQPARDALIEFYNTYYSADLMTLTLASNQSLDEIEQLAREKFSSVARLNNVPETKYPALFVDGELPKVVEIKPIDERRLLRLSFPLPPQKAFYRESPMMFVASLLNAEGEDSLSDRLKSKGWIEGVQAGPGMNRGGNDSLSVGVSLTQQGLAHQDEIIAAVFDQINLVREQGVEEWRYNDLKNLHEMRFRFSENGHMSMRNAIQFSNTLHNKPPSMLIGSGYQKFDEPLIRSMLAELRPDNMVVTLVAPSVETNQTTPFYGADYRTYQPGKERVARWQQPLFSDLSLPYRNPLRAENYDLMDVQSAEKPKQLIDSSGMDVWHFPYIKEGQPKANIRVALDRSEKPGTVQGTIEYLYFSLMAEQMEDLRYRAKNAGLYYSVSSGQISFGGYSNKLPELIEETLSQLLHPTFSQQQFDRLKARLQRQLRNADKLPPTKLVANALDNLINANSLTFDQLAAALEGITLEQVLQASGKLYSNSSMLMLASGNVTAQQTTNLAEKVQKELGLSSMDQKVSRKTATVKVAQAAKPEVFEINSAHQDAVVLRYYQASNDGPEENLLVRFLGKLVPQYYFDSLRTEQQLGYLVQASSTIKGSVSGLTFMVQSPVVDANAIEAATDVFVQDFKATLDGMSDADLMPLKQAMIVGLKAKPKGLRQRVASFWSQLRRGSLKLKGRSEFIAGVEAITMERVREYYQEMVLDQPRSLSVIAPGEMGGVNASVKTVKEFHQNNEVYSRSRG